MRTFLLVATMLAGAVGAAAAPRAHTHGAAELQVVVEGERLEIALEAPLEVLLGFEHAPATEAQRNAVRAMAQRLRDPAPLFVLPAAARCALQSVSLQSPALPPALLGAGPGASTGPAEDGHADLDATYVYRCATPARLEGLELGLGAAFPRLKTLSVQIVSPRGQAARTLRGGERKLSW